MTEALLAFLGFTGIVIAALLGIIGRQVTRKPEHNPADPDATRSGEMSAQYWLSEFARLHGRFDSLIDKLHDIETILRERLPPHGGGA